MIERELRVHWWPAVAAVTRAVGDLRVAEDAVQEACLIAVTQWPRDGTPASPRAWLTGTARHKAVDVLRRDAARTGKETSAVHAAWLEGPADESPDDQLSLIFLCCHPAFDLPAQVALTLRSVCGMDTAEIAAVLLLPEPTVAKRLVRARRKIRDTGMGFSMPADPVSRLAPVLRVIYLLFTEGHKSSTGAQLVRGDLCDTAISLARSLHDMLPDQSEAAGLLALLLLTDARRTARMTPDGLPVLLAAQDRSLYDPAMIAEGEHLLETELRRGAAGPYLIQAAIAACHSTAPTAADTDWREIAALYSELLRCEPSPVHEANRGVAVAMSEGPAAGLVILDVLISHHQLGRWPGLHLARADLLTRVGRVDDARAALFTALELDPSPPERRFIHQRLAELASPYRHLSL